MTPEREAEARRRIVAGKRVQPSQGRELLAALDAERAARQAAERERDEAQAALVALRDAWGRFAADLQPIGHGLIAAEARNRLDLAAIIARVKGGGR